MPCNGGGPDPFGERMAKLKDKLDDAAKAACELSRVIKENFPAVAERLFTSNLRGKPTKGMPLLSKETINWVIRHEREDSKRIAKEQKEVADNRRRKELAETLSVEDLRLLGVRFKAGSGKRIVIMPVEEDADEDGDEDDD